MIEIFGSIPTLYAFLTMNSLSQLGPLKPPTQLHMQVSVFRVPPFWHIRLQADTEQNQQDNSIITVTCHKCEPVRSAPSPIVSVTCRIYSYSWDQPGTLTSTGSPTVAICTVTCTGSFIERPSILTCQRTGCSSKKTLSDLLLHMYMHTLIH